MPTMKTEITHLRSELSHARKEDTALEKINHELSNSEQLQHQRINKLLEEKASLPREFTKHSDLILSGAEKAGAKVKREKVESTTEESKPEQHSSKHGAPPHSGRVSDPNACEANPNHAVPKKDSDGSGFSRLTICNEKGVPEKQTYFDLDSKTKTGFKQWFSDGHTETIQLSPDGRTPKSRDIENPDRSGVFIRYSADGKSITEKDVISSSGRQKFEQYNRQGKLVSEFKD